MFYRKTIYNFRTFKKQIEYRQILAMGWSGVELIFEKSIFRVLHPTVGWSVGWSFSGNFLVWGGVGWSILAENFQSAPPHCGVEQNRCSTPRWGGVGWTLHPIRKANSTTLG